MKKGIQRLLGAGRVSEGMGGRQHTLEMLERPK